MRKLMIIGLCSLLAMSLSGCGSEAPQVEAEQAQGGIILTPQETTQGDNKLEAYEDDAQPTPGDTSDTMDQAENEQATEIIDLTQLSSTMVYGEIYNMLVVPEAYEGKTIKMQGLFDILEVPETGEIYTACVVYDATACCAQGIAFVVNDATYPNDYPELYTPITITGVFQETPEDAMFYFNLVDAVLESQVAE